LDRARGEFEAAGTQLVLIGQGSPRQTSHFRRRQELSMPVLCDEERASYKLVGARIGAMHELIGPKSVLKGLATTARTGQMQGRPVGNVAQLGGVMVIAPGGRAVFKHMAKDASDNAEIDDILTAVKSAGVPPPHHRRA
jgi:hypothetical protein